MKEELSAKAVEEWLIVQIAKLIGQKTESIDVHKSFADYGLSSLDAVSLSGDLEEILNQQLPPTLAYDHPSISMLSQYLANKKPSETTKSNNSANKSDPKEAIAIVGMGCRFPGASSPEEYWQLLSQGVDKISDVPKDRWDNEQFYHPDPSVPGKATTFKGGYLDNIDQFDPFFFGISPSEAQNTATQTAAPRHIPMPASSASLDGAPAGHQRLVPNGVPPPAAGMQPNGVAPGSRFTGAQSSGRMPPPTHAWAQPPSWGHQVAQALAAALATNDRCFSRTYVRVKRSHIGTLPGSIQRVDQLLIAFFS